MARMNVTSGLTLPQLERRLEQRRREVAKLQRQRAKVQKRLDAIDARIESVGGFGGSSAGGGRANGAGRSRPRNDLSLPDAIHQVLTKAGGAVPVGEIADKVLAGGYKSNSANFRGIVNQALIKDKRFTSASRGVYQLKK